VGIAKKGIMMDAVDDARIIDSPRGLLRLRPETEADQAFRFRLYGDSRPDLALLPAHARDQIVMLQFCAQSIAYRAEFPQARFDIIERAGMPIGRIVVDRPGTMVHLVDQALSPPYRNLGIGSAIMRALMDEAERAGLPLRLQVASHNEAARRLYARLGFSAIVIGATDSQLEWCAPPIRS
jgi:ribosomal protein S18 acetylase RimI-like enzyme